MAYRNDCKGSIPLQAANCTEVSCLLRPNFSVWYPVQSCCYLPLHPQALRVSVDLKGRTRTASRLARSGLTEESAFLSALFPAQAHLRKKSMGRLEQPLLFSRWDKYCRGHVIRGKAPKVSTWGKSLKSWNWPAVYILWGKSLDVVCCTLRGKVLWDESYCFMC